MKYRTVIEREGEKLGPVDWSHDFSQYFSGYCVSEERQKEIVDGAVARLRQLEEGLARGEKWLACSITSDYERQVYDVGMYDGWPYWRPVPSVLLASPLGGGEWYSVGMLGSVKRSKAEAARGQEEAK